MILAVEILVEEIYAKPVRRAVYIKAVATLGLCTRTWKKGRLLLLKANLIICYHIQTCLLCLRAIVMYALGRSAVGYVRVGPGCSTKLPGAQLHMYYQPTSPKEFRDMVCITNREVTHRNQSYCTAWSRFANSRHLTTDIT